MSEEILATEQRRDSASESDVLRDVFEVSYRRLVVQLYAVTGDSAEAEDLVQEAFVRAAAAGPSLPEGREPRGLAARRGDQPAPQPLAQDAQLLQDPLPPRAADGPARPRGARRGGQRAASPARPRSGEVLALYYLADLPVAEVAATLGCAVGTVKSRLMRGREALAETLGPWEGSSDV